MRLVDFLGSEPLIAGADTVNYLQQSIPSSQIPSTMKHLFQLEIHGNSGSQTVLSRVLLVARQRSWRRDTAAALSNGLLALGDLMRERVPIWQRDFVRMGWNLIERCTYCSSPSKVYISFVSQRYLLSALAELRTASRSLKSPVFHRYHHRGTLVTPVTPTPQYPSSKHHTPSPPSTCQPPRIHHPPTHQPNPPPYYPNLPPLSPLCNPPIPQPPSSSPRHLPSNRSSPPPLSARPSSSPVPQSP